MQSVPEFPAGPFEAIAPDPAEHRRLIAELAEAPARLRAATADLSAGMLDTRYRNWTVRQIVHHVADSHLHSYVRFKWALTEDRPTIKAYDENAWSALPDATASPLESSLTLLDGLHARWVSLLHAMSAEDFGRTFVHPQTGDTRTLGATLAYYAWHGRHHTAQVQWLRDHQS